jgi:hypothetical protein
MKQGNHKIFLDRQKLYSLVNYRINGYSIYTLSELFQCDTSSVRYQLDKYGIRPLSQVFTIERVLAPIIYQSVPNEWNVIEGIRVNPGHDYKDYLKRANIPIQRYYN